MWKLWKSSTRIHKAAPAKQAEIPTHYSWKWPDETREIPPRSGLPADFTATACCAGGSAVLTPIMTTMSSAGRQTRDPCEWHLLLLDLCCHRTAQTDSRANAAAHNQSQYSRSDGPNVQRVPIPSTGSTLKTKGSTMSAKITLRHTVTCYECGAQVTDLTRTKTAIRNELRGQGWIVAIPMWAAGLGTRGDPTIARKTVDCCPSCGWKQKVEAMRKLEEYNRWRGKVITSGRLQ
jgi:hypothetical protein